MPILRGSQKTLLLCAPTPPPPRCRTVGPNSKNLANIRGKIVELKDHSYAPDCLTNFEYKANEMTGYGNHVNLINIFCEIISDELIFGGF